MESFFASFRIFGIEDFLCCSIEEIKGKNEKRLLRLNHYESVIEPDAKQHAG